MALNIKQPPSQGSSHLRRCWEATDGPNNTQSLAFRKEAKERVSPEHFTNKFYKLHWANAVYSSEKLNLGRVKQKDGII